MSEERTNCLEPPGSVVSEAVELCRMACVEKVAPAIHHGCLRFLMAVEGDSENVGGIVYSANTYSLDDLRALADEVNKILSQNNVDRRCEPDAQ